jgi:hypothetical protein
MSTVGVVSSWRRAQSTNMADLMPQGELSMPRTDCKVVRRRRLLGYYRHMQRHVSGYFTVKARIGEIIT